MRVELRPGLRSGPGLALCALCVLAAPAGAQDPPAYTVRLAVAQDRPRVGVRARGLEVRDGDVGDVLLRGVDALDLRPAGGGIRLANSAARPRSVLLATAGAAAPIRVDGRALIGGVEVRLVGGGLLVINRLPLERYLRGLVGAEMSPRWPLEALAAQAVAARTYFMQRRLQRQGADYDLSASTLDQVYRGIGRESDNTRRAVRRTRGLVLTWGKQPAEALYHACCGGRTRAAGEVFGNAVPYLRSVADPDCSACPKHRWTVRLELDWLARRLRRLGWRGPLRGVAAAAGGLALLGPQGRRLVIDRRQLRRAAGMRRVPSSRFRATVEGDTLVLTGRGSGHGVGLCQWGARGMAEKGADFRAILKRYYPGCRLRKLY